MINRAICLIALQLFFFIGAVQAVQLTDPTNAHNLSSTSTNTVRAITETRICVFCHTPHGAVAQTALWNRKDPASIGSFPLYSSVTLNIDDPGIVGLSGYDTTDYPNGASRMCLSCHDGVSAIGEVINGFSGGTTAMTFNTVSGPAVIDLSTSHPISFIYDAAVRDAINTAEGGINYQLSGNAKVATDGAARVQCTTCHDPHNDTKTAGYNLPFWSNYTGNSVNDYDNTCLACHLGADWGGPQPHSL